MRAGQSIKVREVKKGKQAWKYAQSPSSCCLHVTNGQKMLPSWEAPPSLFFPLAFVAVNKKKIVFQPLSFDLASVCTQYNGSPAVPDDEGWMGERERER